MIYRDNGGSVIKILSSYFEGWGRRISFIDLVRIIEKGKVLVFRWVGYVLGFVVFGDEFFEYWGERLCISFSYIYRKKVKEFLVFE